MSLYKRGGVWWSTITWQKERHQFSTHTGDRKIAEKIEGKKLADLATGAAGLYELTSKVTLKDFEERFFSYLQGRIGARTTEGYKSTYKTLLAFEPLATARLHQIDGELIQRFVDDRRAAKLNPGTINTYLRTLHRALAKAAEWHLLHKCPKIELLKGERSREWIFTEETLKDFVKRAKEPLASLLPFLVDTGLRISECIALTWDTVSLEPKPGAERGWVFVAKGKSKAAKRYVPLTARAHAILTARKPATKDGINLVWTNANGEALSRHYLSEQFKYIRIAMKLPWDACIHSTRHTFCTRLGESGCDAFSLKALAGHSSIVISQRYCHPTPPRLEAAIGSLDKFGVKSETASA